MGIFDFLKKNKNNNLDNFNSCCENKNFEDLKNYKFLVLGGNCCKNSILTFENTKKALIELDLKEEVLNVADQIEISKFGVMKTPALVINNKVVSYGKKLTISEIKELIKNNI